MTAGPLVGGTLIALAGWRWIFFVNLPIGLLGFWLTWRYASETTRSPQREVDLPGQVMAIAALGCLAGAIIEGGAIGWSHPFVLAGFAGFVIFALLFVVREQRAAQPMLPLTLFSKRMFSVTAMVGLLVNIAFYGLIFIFSLYFQRINGWSAFATGLAFVPMLGAVLPVNLVAARIAERIGAPQTIALGATIAAAGCLGLLFIAPGTSYWAVALQLVALGGGLGLLVPPLTSTLLGSVEKSRSGVAAGVLNSTRQTGSVLGVALFGSLIGAVERLHGRHACGALDLGRVAADRGGGGLVERDESRGLSGEGGYALRSAKCAPQNAMAAPRHSAAKPASTPEIIEPVPGAAAAWPAPASSSTPTAIRNCRIRCGICPATALCIRLAVK